MVGTDRSAYDSHQLAVLDDLLAASARGPEVRDLVQHLCAVGPGLIPYDELQLVVAEVDCGWVPYYKEQIDNNYQRLLATSDFIIKELPSVYVERNVHFTFLTDPFGIRSRYDIGVDSMLWSSDYPHISADWPNSWRTIEAVFSGVPRAERDLILAGNAARLYGFGR